MAKGNGIFREGSKSHEVLSILKVNDKISATALAEKMGAPRMTILWTINSMVKRGLNVDKESLDKDLFYTLDQKQPINKKKEKKKYKKIPRKDRRVKPGVNIFQEHSARWYLFELLKKYNFVSSKALCKELKQSTGQLHYIIFGMRDKGIEIETTRQTDGTYYRMVDKTPKEETQPHADPVKPKADAISNNIIERAFGYMCGQGECVCEDLAEFLNVPAALALRIMKAVASKNSQVHIEIKSIILKVKTNE